MLYGVSLAYKESANCRLEANYAHQQELDMIPLMMSEDCKPKGWLGLILGTRMWCKYALLQVLKPEIEVDRGLTRVMYAVQTVSGTLRVTTTLLSSAALTLWFVRLVIAGS